jgi:soluble lytic murein transglycosylase-like protein
MPSGFCGAAYKVPELRVAALLFALVLIAPGARADRQQDPELKAVLQKAITAGQCFTEKYDAEVWYKLMEPRLRKYVKDLGERIEILTNVYCEARHSQLPAELVLAVMDVESSFNRWAVSSAGAQGLMQVMPFWPEQLGMRRHQLVQIQPNIRMGCAILKFYYDRERRDVRKALARYNGSVGRRDYPDLVISRWTSRWRA